MIIKSQDANEKKRGPMLIKEYKINRDFSGSLIEIDGDHGTLKSLTEDRIYFIIAGAGKFVIDGHEENVAKEDLIFIPKNTPYNVTGKLKYLLICSPEFDFENDVPL